MTLPPTHGEWVPDDGTYEDGATEEQRRDEVRATTCRRVGHHWTPDGVCDRCGDPRPAAVHDLMAALQQSFGCERLGHAYDGAHCRRCGSDRPAAVTAPREEAEVYSDPDLTGDHLLQPLIPNQPARWADFTDAQVAAYRAAESAAAGAAARAVERATPDPDTLNALTDLLETMDQVRGARYVASRLIAAGVTVAAGPASEPCAACGGDGWLDDSDGCAECQGTGRRTVTQALPTTPGRHQTVLTLDPAPAPVNDNVPCDRVGCRHPLAEHNGYAGGGSLSGCSHDGCSCRWYAAPPATTAATS